MRNLIIVFMLFVISCKPKVVVEQEAPVENTSPEVKEEIVVEIKDSIVLTSFAGITDSTFVRLADFSNDFVYDMRYATTNNFLKTKVYDCAECYTRARTAKALIEANKDFMRQGYKIKFFDCYRPNSVQFKMWKLVPNPQYVASPIKGSIHNKGGAVDITLVSLEGEELDMGTDFDFFGKLAHHDYEDLPKAVLENRKLLKETMEKHGFWSIRTEWWHYNLSGGSTATIADFKWPCPE